MTWHVLRVYYVWVLWSRDSTCAGARRASIPQIPTRIPQIPQIPTRRSRWLPGPYHQWRLQTPFPAECLESQRVEDPPVRDREGSGRGDREDDACPPAHAEIPQRDAGWERLVWDADHSAGGLDPTLDPVAGAGEAESEGVLYCVLDLWWGGEGGSLSNRHELFKTRVGGRLLLRLSVCLSVCVCVCVCDPINLV